MMYNLESMEAVDVHKLMVSCTRGYAHYHKNRQTEPIVKEVLAVTDGKWEKAVRWWVSNCIRTKRRSAKGFTVSLRPAGYTANVQGIGYRGVKSLLALLESRAFIHVYKGYVEEWKVENGKRVPEKVVKSVVVLRERAIRMVGGVDASNKEWDEVEEQDFVVIRDRETKKPKSTKGVGGLKEERNRMKQINQHLAKSEITFDGVPIADVIYSRIFSDTKEMGGRLYAFGGGVQTIPADIRLSSLEIDGEPVVELDYSAIHPNICYQMLYTQDGLDVLEVTGEDFSPYSADLSFVEVDEELKAEWESLTGRKCNPLRELAKRAILISMNSKDRHSAVSGLAHKIVQDRKRDVKDQLFYPLKKVSAPMVCDALQEHNDVIGQHFFSDTGILLQKIDSDIMLEIVSTMIQKGHTVLCYHDSAIVKQSAEEDLYQAMKDAWVTVLGDDKFCKIERK